MTAFKSCIHGKFHADCFECGRESFKEELIKRLDDIPEASMYE